MKQAVRILLITAGVISIALGVLGIFLPLLPTTPFLLLAAACFIRSSRRLYDWLLKHRYLGPYIRNYRKHRAIPKRMKIILLVLLWATLGYSIIAVVENLLVRILLGAIGIAVTIHILSMKTLTAAMIEQSKESSQSD